uniref:Uncharacterized protein n=1 Tax=viral metagenome TaxID=1070528 RepID=A0A6C0JVH2_9ZZZZ
METIHLSKAFKSDPVFINEGEDPIKGRVWKNELEGETEKIKNFILESDYGLIAKIQSLINYKIHTPKKKITYEVPMYKNGDFIKDHKDSANYLLDQCHQCTILCCFKKADSGGEIIVDGVKYSLEEGDVLIFDQNKIHSGEVVKGIQIMGVFHVLLSPLLTNIYVLEFDDGKVIFDDYDSIPDTIQKRRKTLIFKDIKLEIYLQLTNLKKGIDFNGENFDYHKILFIGKSFNKIDKLSELAFSKTEKVLFLTPDEYLNALDKTFFCKDNLLFVNALIIDYIVWLGMNKNSSLRISKSYIKTKIEETDPHEKLFSNDSFGESEENEERGGVSEFQCEVILKENEITNSEFLAQNDKVTIESVKFVSINPKITPQLVDSLECFLKEKVVKENTHIFHLVINIDNFKRFKL